MQFVLEKMFPLKNLPVTQDQFSSHLRIQSYTYRQLQLQIAAFIDLFQFG